MNTVPLSKLLITVVAISALAACSDKTKTTIPLTWRNPGYEQTVFKKLLVVGVSQNEEGRRLFEDTFAKALSSDEGTALPSWGHLPQSTQLTEEQIRGAIEGGGYDGLLITQVLSVDENKEYVPGSTHTVAPRNFGYYGGYGYYGYYGYYSGSYASVHDPGYFKTDTTFRLETNLYSVATGGLVWSGQSDTVDPESVADVIDSMTAAVAKQLRQEKLIP
ncbi:MAG: hypothetical protein WCE62_10935 [Polyangiales bacterium]